MSFTPDELKSLVAQVDALAKKAGAFIRQERSIFDNARIEYKGEKDLVSYVDKETEKMLVIGLRELLPQAGFITEEKTVKTEEKQLKWVIDPLDGTTNFIHNLPIYSVSIGLLDGDFPILGVVYEVNKDESFTAWKGGGAYLNGKKIQVSPIFELKKSLIATGFPYDLEDKTDPYFEIMKELVRYSHGLRRMGSAAVDMCYVACGRLEAYYEFNIQLWDIAAGVVILTEAGGTATNFDGKNNFIHSRTMIAAGGIHKELYEIIKKHWHYHVT
ncbi:MAG: inositol monophosphatase [Cytophagales bacterium]|nr:inositol monophosphatase [Cytophagales bacterium]